MDAERKTTLLEQAAERYNAGQYDEAMSLWREVLALDPSDQKAREGIRMASLLTTDWSSVPSPADAGQDVAPAAPRAGSDEVSARLQEGIARVKSLVADGKIDEALEGCDLLAQIAPEDEEVKLLAAQVRRAAERPSQRPAADGIEKHLAAAREALAGGRNRQAAEAAQKALEIDPSNMEACGILSMAADDELAASPVAIGGSARPTPGGDFDTGEIPSAGAPAGVTSSGADPKVADLIARGRSALEAGNPEAAIEIWSRVFAIDSTNAQAGALIDQAKAAIDEQGRQVDELFYKGVDAAEAGRDQEALDLFRRVLGVAPTHHDARAAIAEIEARLGGLGGEIAIDPKAASEVVREKRRGLGSVEADADVMADLFKEPASVPLADPFGEGTFQPRASAGAARKAPPRPAIIAPRRAAGGSKLLVASAGVVLVGVVGIGAWLWLGNGTASMRTAEATVPAPVSVRTKPRGAPVKPSEQPPAPAQAAESPAGAKEAPAPAAPAPRDPEELKAQAAALTREGREYYRQQRWAEAALAFKKALSTAPIEFDAQDELATAMARLEAQATIERETSQAATMFAEGDYPSALQKFYRLQQDYPEMRILDAYIENSWFNWGLALLQAGAVDEAVEKFDEVLQIDPASREATRAREVCKRYHGRPRDAAFDAFAGALPFRALDQR